MSKPTTNVVVSDVLIPAPIHATATWEQRPRLCPHCGLPIAQHQTRDAEAGLEFFCGEHVIHTRRTKR